MQIKDVDKLKAWLFNKLEPLCDADPTALSKYVVALLRKEKPKAALKELCIDQLEVFLAKETVAFVEKLFRCLESESYLKREETPPPPPTKSKPSEQIQSSGQNTNRRLAEDVRQKEVDDDDRDFRRSKRHELEGNGDHSKRSTALISNSRGDSIFAGKKRRTEDSGVVSSVKRRVIEGRSRTLEPPSSTSSTVMDSTSTATSSEPTSAVPASVRRPVRERLGPRPTEDRSDSGWSGGRRHHRGHSSTHSRSSSSESGSASDSESSTGSSMGGGKLSRKRKKRSDHSRSTKKRQRCKDYDEKGFCILGESCPYDHGIDPVVIGGGISPYPLGLAPPPGLPLPPLGKPNLLVQPLLPPVLPRPASPPPSTTSTDGYNPEDPGLSSSSSSHGFIPTPIIAPHPLPLQQSFPPPSIGGISIPPPPSMMSFPRPPHLSASTTLTASTNFHHQMRTRPPTHFSGRGPMKPSDTLIIRKVPRELNTITKLSSHFEKFGTIVNLTVRYEGDPEGALVQFSNPTEAKKAHSSTEAVLNNRFIRIYFLRKDHVSAQMPLTEVTLETPASVAISTIHGVPPCPAPPHLDKRVDVTEPVTRREHSENHITEVSKDKLFSLDMHHQTSAVKTSPSPTFVPDSAPPQPHAPPPPAPPTAQQRRKSAEAAKKKLELQKKTHELLQRQIQQQKLLISKLEKSGKHLSADEKESIMKSLKTLASSISKLKEAASRTVANKNKTETVAQKSAPMHEELQPLTMDLKAKAAALRKQAHMLGLLSSPSQPLPSVGEGHDLHPDLRSKLSKHRQLLVINVTNRDQLTSYFDSFGGLERVEVDPDNSDNLIFTFRNKTIANQVVNKGSVLNGKPLIMKWYTPKPGPTIPTVKTSKLSSLPLPHHHLASEISKSTSLDTTVRRVVIEKKTSTKEQPLDAATPTLTKLDPEELHLVEDSDEEEDGRSWRR